MIQALLPLLACCLLAVADRPQGSLRLVPADKIWIQDSIPEKAGERIVVWAGNMQAHWVVSMVNLPYERTREQIRDLVYKTFGIKSERQMIVNKQAQRNVNAHMPREPLLGDGFSDFSLISTSVDETREYRIESTPYNTQMRWWESSSQSEWRVIDGSLLFGRACTLLVVSRTDHTREWAWMHPGIPMPFTVTGDTKLVTDTEVALIETLVKNTGRPQIHYFVPNTVYQTNGVLDLMTAIHEAAKELPEAGMKQDGS